MAVWVSFDQPPAGCVKTYAAPWRSFAPILAPGAPAIAVVPETATELPSRSDLAPSEAVSLAAWVSLDQPPAGCVKT